MVLNFDTKSLQEICDTKLLSFTLWGITTMDKVLLIEEEVGFHHQTENLVMVNGESGWFGQGKDFEAIKYKIVILQIDASLFWWWILQG